MKKNSASFMKALALPTALCVGLAAAVAVSASAGAEQVTASVTQQGTTQEYNVTATLPAGDSLEANKLITVAIESDKGVEFADLKAEDFSWSGKDTGSQKHFEIVGIQKAEGKVIYSFTSDDLLGFKKEDLTVEAKVKVSKGTPKADPKVTVTGFDKTGDEVKSETATADEFLPNQKTIKVENVKLKDLVKGATAVKVSLEANGLTIPPTFASLKVNGDAQKAKDIFGTDHVALEEADGTYVGTVAAFDKADKASVLAAEKFTDADTASIEVTYDSSDAVAKPVLKVQPYSVAPEVKLETDDEPTPAALALNSNQVGQDAPSEEKTATISGTVVIDHNADGNWDSKVDSTALNVGVVLLDKDGQPVPGVAEQRTKADGTYSFTNVPEGDYKVRFDASKLADAQKIADSRGGISDMVTFFEGNPKIGETGIIVVKAPSTTVDAAFEGIKKEGPSDSKKPSSSSSTSSSLNQPQEIKKTIDEVMKLFTPLLGLGAAGAGASGLGSGSGTSGTSRSTYTSTPRTISATPTTSASRANTAKSTQVYRSGTNNAAAVNRANSRTTTTRSTTTKRASTRSTLANTGASVFLLSLVALLFILVGAALIIGRRELKA